MRVRRPLASLARLLKRRTPAVPHAQDGVADPRAEELRRKLAESRALVEEREEFEAAEPTVEQTEHAPDDPDRRRRKVHATGRTVAQQMRRR
jgi:hypothetical protein